MRRALAAAATLLLGGCAVGPREFIGVSEAQIASTAPPPLRAIYEGAIRSTVVGVVHHPISSTSAGIAAIKNRTRELAPVELFLAGANDSAEPDAPGSAGFERQLDDSGFQAPHPGTIDFLVDGPAFFPRLKAAIDEAEESIDWMVYIFDNDDYAIEIADRLKARSQSVRTRILTDRLGSVMAGYSPPATPMPAHFVQPASIQRYLEHRSKVVVRKQPNPWLVSDHTKLLLFDRRVAFLGGMNIGREYRSEWHDLMVELRGPVVEQLAGHFKQRWRRSGNFGDMHLFDRRKPVARRPAAAGEIPIRILETAPWRYEIERAQIAAARASRRQIVVLTPYFTSDAMMVELQRAAARGVDVRVILPRENDSGVMHLSNAETAARLAERGVAIYRFPGLMHLKAAIYDDWVCLGSANMDTLSLRINREKNIAFSDPATVARFRREVVDRDLGLSRRVGLEELQRERAPWIKILGDQL